MLAPIANAQDVPASTSNAGGFASGWWSPVKDESAIAPQLLISLAELTHFEVSSFRPSSSRPTTHRVGEPINGQIARRQYFRRELRVRTFTPSLLAESVSPTSGSLLSLLQARYAMWQSSLEDSRSLVDVNGVSVYPFLQINYAGWQLPVTLYVSSLRGSDTR
jgi:hypothetical protein